MPATPSTVAAERRDAATPPPGTQRVYPGEREPARADARRRAQGRRRSPLPDDPLEPYLLTKENGPFMVLAKVFRGPDAEKMALALCKELRQDFDLPAYILRTKDFPMKSYIRGTPLHGPERDHEGRDQAARAGPDPRRGRGPGREREDPRRRPRSCSTRSRSSTPSAWRGCPSCSSGAKVAGWPGRSGRPIPTSRRSCSIPGRRTGWWSR